MIVQSFKRPSEWITFGFDDEGRLKERSIQFGLFSVAARQLFTASDSERRGYTLACGLLVSPDLDPDKVKEIVSDSLSLKLPAPLGKWLPPYNRSVWVGGDEVSFS